MVANPLVKDLTEAIAVILTEAYAGPPDPSSTWFIDNAPDSGILGILSRVTAEEASTSVDGSGESGTTIASHAEHLRWSLANANAAFRGEPFNPNWNESWRVVRWDEAAWDGLRQSLRTEFEAMREHIRAQNGLRGDYLLGTLALLPHAGYHLGNIRQMLERVRG